MNLITQEPQPITEYRTIPLTQGKFAIVDAEDFERLQQWKWCAHYNPETRTFYAVTNVGGKLNHRTISMHREIMGHPKGYIVDHRNHDTLDNRRCNLRKATPIESAQNRLTTHNKSGFKGVEKRGKKWRARITVNRKEIWIGTFSTAELAHAAYKEAARKWHGEFSYEHSTSSPAPASVPINPATTPVSCTERGVNIFY